MNQTEGVQENVRNMLPSSRLNKRLTLVKERNSMSVKKQRPDSQPSMLN
jgi:hypothetical protein